MSAHKQDLFFLFEVELQAPLPAAVTPASDLNMKVYIRRKNPARSAGHTEDGDGLYGNVLCLHIHTHTWTICLCTAKSESAGWGALNVDTKANQKQSLFQASRAL